jgi:chromosome segregation ATPase
MDDVFAQLGRMSVQLEAANKQVMQANTKNAQLSKRIAELDKEMKELEEEYAAKNDTGADKPASETGTQAALDKIPTPIKPFARNAST